MARVKVETNDGKLVYALHSNLFNTMDTLAVQTVLNDIASEICEAIQIEDALQSEFETYWVDFKASIVDLMSKDKGGDISVN